MLLATLPSLPLKTFYVIPVYASVQERAGPSGHRVRQARPAHVDHERGFRALWAVGKRGLPQQSQRLPSRLHLIRFGR